MDPHLFLDEVFSTSLGDEVLEEPDMLDTILSVGIFELFVGFLGVLVFTDVEGDHALFLGGIFFSFLGGIGTGGAPPCLVTSHCSHSALVRVLGRLLFQLAILMYYPLWFA